MIELLTADRSVECPTYAHNARLLIPRLHNAGQFDSVALILDYIDSLCHQSYFDGYRMLRSVGTGEISEDWCDSAVVHNIIHGVWTWQDCWPLAWLPYRERNPDTAMLRYAGFLNSYADTLIERTDSNSVAHVLCRHVRGHDGYILRRLRAGAFGGTCLRAEFDRAIEDVDRTLMRDRVHLAANLGVWSPLANAALLGRKIEFGGSVGFRPSRLGFDLTILVRFLKCKQDYVVRNDNVLDTTDHFFSGYIGGNLVYSLGPWKRFGLEGFGGIGYDGIEAVYTKEGDNNESLNSFNTNFGVTAQYFFNHERNRYLGLQFRYNIVDYVTHGGTDLSGNTISVNLIYGYLGNYFVTSRAKRLHYYD